MKIDFKCYLPRTLYLNRERGLENNPLLTNIIHLRLIFYSVECTRVWHGGEKGEEFHPILFSI